MVKTASYVNGHLKTAPVFLNKYNIYIYITQHESMVGWVGVFMLSETVGVYVGLDANFGSRSHLTYFCPFGWDS